VSKVELEMVHAHKGFEDTKIIPVINSKKAFF